MEQNNVRKYLLYALGEIALVMIGILLALQVNNWNELRLENIKADEYLNRLAENLEEDISLIRNRINFLEEVKDYAKLAINHAEDSIDEEIEEWQILLAYFQSSQIWPLVLTDVTYNELKSAGELDLIKNFQLRKDLAIYYGEQYQQYTNTVGTIPAYREKIRGLIPYYIQEYIWANCHETKNTNQNLISCNKPKDISAEAIVTLTDEIKNDQVIYDLRFWASNLDVGIDIIRSQGNQADSLTALIINMKRK